MNRRTENERKISVTGLDGFSDYAIQTICLIKKVSCVWEWLDLARAMMDFPGPDLIKAIIDLNPWNIPPKPDANGPYFANEGQEIIFNASGSIDEDDDELEYRWDFDSNGTVDTAWSSNPIASNTWHDDFKGNATLYVRDLNTPQTPWNYTAMANVTVNNVAPSVEAGENQVVNEADTVYFNGDFSDIGDDTHTIEWNLDDGSTFSGTLTPTHVYVDNGVYTVTLTVTDDDGGVGTDTLTVIVNNVAPSATFVSMEQPNPKFILPTVHNVTFMGSFIDLGWLDTHTSNWDFGDGLSDAGTLTEENEEPDATGTTIAEHAYSEPGTYTITLAVMDDDEGVGTNTLVVTVMTGEEATTVVKNNIQIYPDEAFKNNPGQKKKTFSNKLDAVIKQIFEGNYQEAIDKLRNDIGAKADGALGGNPNNDWITDPEAQDDLWTMIGDLIDYLETLL